MDQQFIQSVGINRLPEADKWPNVVRQFILSEGLASDRSLDGEDLGKASESCSGLMSCLTTAITCAGLSEYRGFTQEARHM